MSNKVDKLFKDKLEGDSLQPSAQAWDKVEAHLGKKNKMVLWLRVAAALMLLGLLMFVGVNWTGGNSEREIVRSQKPEVRSKDPEVRSQKPEGGSGEAVVEEPKVNRKQNTPIVIPVLDQPLEQPVEQLAIVPEPAVELQLNNKLQPTDVETQPTTHSPQPTTQKGITLTYSLPAVKKQEAPAEPMIAQKKTGFERVMEIAKEVKSGDALGELRQAKDDIFALDFRKDKKNKQ
ncbi:MAG TPA: hypothetical protein VF473_09980 [Cyclobacteriaceae bacterium]